MALRLARTLDSGLVVPNAYHRVERVGIDYARQTVTLDVQVYATGQARIDGKRPIPMGMSFAMQGADWDAFIANGRGPLVLAYIFLKTRPEFSGAVDV